MAAIRQDSLRGPAGASQAVICHTWLTPLSLPM
jgi:hypothetical protein